MLERLTEYWLDSASERSYQPAFVQMLIAEGHRVLHSTRHAPIEFGKDVVTIGPDGVACAFQLKGNPGGRITSRQMREEIQPQLFQLVTQAIPYPGIPDGPHRSFLVTNGGIEEEAQRVITDMNRQFERAYGPDAIQVWTRGDLLDRARRMGSSLWPFGVTDLSALLEMLTHRGDDMLPLRKIHALLCSIYRLSDTENRCTRAEIPRLVTSAAILIAVALSNFGRKDNHVAVTSAWVLFFSYTIAVCARAGVPVTAEISDCLDAARQTVFESLTSLAGEAMDREHLTEGEAWADNELYHARSALIYGLVSTLWLWCKRDGLRFDGIEAVEGFLPLRFHDRALWGEAAVPQLLAHYWHISQRDPSQQSEMQLGRLLQTLLDCQRERGKEPLASPYYGIDAVVRHQHWDLLPGDDPIEDESFVGKSYCAEGILHLIVRANLKIFCKLAWPDFARVVHRRFDVPNRWQFGLIHVETGSARETIVPARYEWSQLQADAARCRTPMVPNELADDPIMLLLLTIIVPQRATPDVVRYLGWRFSSIWFLPQEPEFD